MWWSLLVVAAHSEEFDGKVQGAPFAPKAVLAAPEPSKAGAMWVMLVEGDVACSDIPKLAKNKKAGRIVNVGFGEAKAGATSREAWGMAATSGQATLVTMPE